MNDVQNTEPQENRNLDLDEATDAILNRWEDAEEPSEQGLEATSKADVETEADDDYGDDQSEDTDEDQEDPDQEEDSDTDEETEEPEAAQDKGVTDETMVEITVDGETTQASIKDLKRLYGQEKALTRKSQETAQRRKEADDAIGKADVSLRNMLERAEARWKPYSDIDMLLASKNMSNEDFSALRQEARLAESDLKFLTQEADQFYGQLKANQAEAIQKGAAECVKVLKEQIPEWSNDYYNKIRSYAVEKGLPEAQVNQYVDPSVIMLINKARLYDLSKNVAATKKAKAPLKTLQSKKSPPNDADRKTARQAETQAKLRDSNRRGGDMDDIAEAIMARWVR
jgi:hypothetical protein